LTCGLAAVASAGVDSPPVDVVLPQPHRIARTPRVAAASDVGKRRRDHTERGRDHGEQRDHRE
jgi:hypothetical protein